MRDSQTLSVLGAALSVAIAANRSVPAQQAQGQVACGDLAVTLQQRESTHKRSIAPIDRVARLSTALLRSEAKPEDPDRHLIGVDYYYRRGSLLVSGPPGSVDLVNALVTQLRRPEARELRVQCTLVQLPASVAEQHGLAAGRATPVDEVAAGRLMKAGLQAQGHIQNLPEVAIEPLQPFCTEPPAGKHEATAIAAALRLRGEAMLLADDEALFGVHLVAGDLPADPTRRPKESLVEATFRMRVGGGVLLLANAAKPPTPATSGDTTPPMTVALWLRFADVVQTPPK
jgi:hypothetical protein